MFSWCKARILATAANELCVCQREALTLTQLPNSKKTSVFFYTNTDTEHETHLEKFGGGLGASRLTHVEVDHGGVLGLSVPVCFWLEAALCGNAHLVVAPGGSRQETGRG